MGPSSLLEDVELSLDSRPRLFWVSGDRSQSSGRPMTLLSAFAFWESFAALVVLVTFLFAVPAGVVVGLVLLLRRIIRRLPGRRNRTELDRVAASRPRAVWWVTPAYVSLRTSFVALVYWGPVVSERELPLILGAVIAALVWCGLWGIHLLWRRTGDGKPTQP